MPNSFSEVIEQLVRDKGKDILLDTKRAASLIVDYALNDYKKEVKLFKAVLEAGCAAYIKNVTNLMEVKQTLALRLEEEEGISPKAAAEMLDILGLVLRDDRSVTVLTETPKAQPPLPPGNAGAVKTASLPPAAPAAAIKNFVYIKGGTFTMGSPASEPER